jgi:hypothetical protein
MPSSEHQAAVSKRTRADKDTSLIEAPSPGFEAAQQTFRLLTTGPQPLSIDGRLFEGLPNRIVDLGELARLLPATPAETQDAVWADLVRRAQTDSPDWVIGAVGVALASLIKIACELCTGYSGELEDIHNEVLAGFCRRLRTLDPDAGRIFARLYWAARRDGAKLRNAESEYAARTWHSDPVEPPKPAGHPDLVLAQAVRDGVLSPWEADVISVTRLENPENTVFVTRLAARSGMSRAQLRYARAQAEGRLARYLSDEKS